MKVWLIGWAGYDCGIIKHVCLSEATALKRWGEVRNELIEESKEMIRYCTDAEYSFEGWTEQIRLLGELKPGESCYCHYPTIEEMEAEA